MSREQVIYILKVLVIFVVLSLVLDRLVFTILNRASDKVLSGQGIGKLNHYLKQKDSLELIIYGNSRVNHSLNTEKFDEQSFNIGVDGTNIAYAECLIKLLPKDKEQIIILHIDPEQAFSKNYAGEDLKKLRCKYHQIDTISSIINRYEQEDPLQSIYKSRAYNGLVFSVIKNYLYPKYDHHNYYGFDPLPTSVEQQKVMKKLVENDRQTECNEELVLNAAYEKAIDDIDKFCHINNKVLIVISSPVYRDNCKEDNIQLRKFLDERDVWYFDYSDFFRNDNSLLYWKDLNHLSEKGANLFTDSFKQDISKFNTNKLK